MASLRDIRNRIKSVKNTQKITKAMKLVAASKLRRAQDAIKRASSEALRMGHHYIGTEHLLLGLLDGSAGLAHQILESLG